MFKIKLSEIRMLRHNTLQCFQTIQIPQIDIILHTLSRKLNFIKRERGLTLNAYVFFSYDYINYNFDINNHRDYQTSSSYHQMNGC